MNFSLALIENQANFAEIRDNFFELELSLLNFIDFGLLHFERHSDVFPQLLHLFVLNDEVLPF